MYDKNHVNHTFPRIGDHHRNHRTLLARQLDRIHRKPRHLHHRIAHYHETYAHFNHPHHLLHLHCSPPVQKNNQHSIDD
jgi:hypothetical protein